MTPSVNPRLKTIRAKIERTKKHVADLEGAVRAFLDSGPYKVATQRDPQSRKLLYYASSVEPVPTEVSQITGDALGSMVSILDHLAYGLFLSGGGVATSPAARDVYFPIARNAKNAAEYKTATQRKIQGMPQTTIDALLAVEAYQGGKGHQLWVLNELNNTSKHRDLIAVGSQFRSLDLGTHLTALMEKTFGHPVPQLPVFYKPADTLCPLKAGDALFADVPDAEVNQKMGFAFEVAIHEPQIIKSEPIIELVHQLLDLVNGIVTQFEPML